MQNSQLSLCRPTADDWVYTYAVAVSGAVKFGSSSNVASRLSHIQISCPQKIHLLARMRSSRNLESFIHFGLRDLRIRGEWFRLRGAARDVVRAMMRDDLMAVCNVLTRNIQ
jgi:hypothetical protein